MAWKSQDRSGLHNHVGLDYKVPFLNSNQNGIQILWQKEPKKVEEVLLGYAAHLFYKLNFDSLRPAIRVAMSTWFFLERIDRRESNLQDEMVIKEIQGYQSCLMKLLHYRKARKAMHVVEVAAVNKVTTTNPKTQRNEMSNSEDKSKA